MIGLLIIFSSNSCKLYLYCSGACILCRIRCCANTWFFLMDWVVAESIGLKALWILIYCFFVFDSALVSVWDLAFIVIDAVHVLNYLRGERHFNARSLLTGSWNTLLGKEHICGAGNKPHHIKHIKHIFLSKPRYRGAAEVSQQPLNVLLCLRGMGDPGCWLWVLESAQLCWCKALSTLIHRYSIEPPCLLGPPKWWDHRAARPHLSEALNVAFLCLPHREDVLLSLQLPEGRSLLPCDKWQD